MRNILVTGGTVFVSRYVAEYYMKKGDKVYVLNRNHRVQLEGVTLIQADRHDLGEVLRRYHFDVVLDITAYTDKDIHVLLDKIGSYDEYIFISSSAVYPEYAVQPFTEKTEVGDNLFWGEYGRNKINAEIALLGRNSRAYILRPPYLYGPMNNVYREAFVFDCAMEERKFHLPKDGEMKLHFFHVEDLCRFMDIILEKKPDQHIFNVGNKDAVSIREWVNLCYEIVGKLPEFINVKDNIEQRNYFSFYDYEYFLDIQAQMKWISKLKPLKEGLRESFEWYLKHPDSVKKKAFIDYIDTNLAFL